MIEVRRACYLDLRVIPTVVYKNQANSNGHSYAIMGDIT